MKKLIALLGLYFLLILINISCKPSHAVINDIDFSSAILKEKKDDKRFSVYKPDSVFTNTIDFIISYDYDYVAQSNAGISACYAFKRATVFNNKLIRDTYSLSFDRDFVFENVTIPAYQNILNNESIKVHVSNFKNNSVYNHGSANEVLEFSEYFVQHSSFGTGKYQVTFQCSSSDNLVLEKNIAVEFHW